MDRLNKVRDAFGLDGLKPGQEECLQHIFEGDDVIALMPTGGGKSLLYQGPAAVDTEGLTVVISPLLALMRDQVGKLCKMGVGACTLNSDQGRSERSRIIDALREGQMRLLYLSPEQLWNKEFRGMKGPPVNRVAVDEAHCVSHWGHDFRPDYLRIGEYVREHEVRQTLALTATASGKVVEEIREALGMEGAFLHIGALLRPNLHYSVEQKASKDKPQEDTLMILEMIEEYAGGKDDSVVIYCATRAETEEVRARLAGFAGVRGLSEITSDFYHAGLKPEEREEKEKAFLEGHVKVLVATNAFGMGVDMPNISLIIHNNIPGDVESYLQETGRAGRDGRETHCVLMYATRDLKLRERFAKAKYPSIDFIWMVHRAMKNQSKMRRNEGFNGGILLDWYAKQALFEDARLDNWSRDSEVISAIDLMFAHGVLARDENNGKVVRFRDFRVDGDEQKAILATLKLREEVAKVTLGRIAKYAKAKKPSQEILLELMLGGLE